MCTGGCKIAQLYVSLGVCICLGGVVWARGHLCTYVVCTRANERLVGMRMLVQKCALLPQHIDII